MATKLLYLDDPYLKEFKASVVEVRENGVILDQTAFYPGGGGQPYDTGTLKWEDITAEVRGMERDTVLHLLDGFKPEEGEMVVGNINWERRYRIMRAHTAVHIVSGVAFKNFGVRITGNQLYEARARLDLSFDNMSRELAERIVEESNEVIKQNLPVKWYWITREEFMEHPELMRVAPHLYEKYEKIRIVSIGDFDIQADGGTHVKNTAEIGEITLEKYVSKGRKNKRMYITLMP